MNFAITDLITPANAAVDLRAAPASDALAVSQCLHGETLTVLQRHGEWLQVENLRDAYQGFVHGASMRLSEHHTTHWVSARSTLLFSEPDIKSPVGMSVPFGAELSFTTQRVGNLIATCSGHFVRADHCLELGDRLTGHPVDHVVAHFTGTPYRWGGRSTAGVDCSGLVQMMAFGYGLHLPRDSRDQEHHPATTVQSDLRARGDLVFWPGHVAMLLDANTVFHANAHSLDCREEALASVMQRAGKPGCFRRLALTTSSNPDPDLAAMDATVANTSSAP